MRAPSWPLRHENSRRSDEDPPADVVTLTLSRRQALALAELVRWIGGEPGGVRDAFNLRPDERESDAEGNSISAQLMRQGIERAPREIYFLRLGEIETLPEWPAEGGAA